MLNSETYIPSDEVSSDHNPVVKLSFTDPDMRRVEIQKLVASLSGQVANPRVFYRINEEIGNIEYIIGENLAAGKGLTGTLEARAIDFIRGSTNLLGLTTQQARSSIFVKYVLRSLMGTHIILGFRYQGQGDPAGQEVLDKSVAIHFSDDERLVMISSIYWPCGQEQEDEEWTKQDRDQLEKTLRDIQRGKYTYRHGQLIKRERPSHIPVEIHVEQKWVTEQTKQGCKVARRIQVKYATANRNLVFLLDKGGAIKSCHSTASGAFLRTTQIAFDHWSDDDPNKKTKVILRDLVREDELRGRYVLVQDNVPAPEIMIWDSLTGDGSRGLTLNSSLPDRVMAYYHVDYIQRYFRELGLRALDDYEGLNPLRIDLGDPLGQIEQTLFLPARQTIVFGLVKCAKKTGMKCTDARSARLIYHECVHAVTDAIARLRRDNAASAENLRFKQVVQAHAMDEGLADYFASSVSARQGVSDPRIAPLIIKDSVLQYDFDSVDARNLESDSPFPCAGLETQLGLEIDPSKSIPTSQGLVDECVIYAWGQEWARFLWRIRELLGAEISDMLIANSIFFLTRWSTFGMGVRALVLTDRLLFGGAHEDRILKDSGGEMAKDWEIEPKEREGDAASFGLTPDDTSISRPGWKDSLNKSAFQQATAD